MRILRIYPFIPPLTGGMENHVYKLTAEQRAAGCNVSLFFNGGERQNEDDVKILPYLNLRKIKPALLRDLVFYMPVFFVLLKAQKKYDVVHIHGDWSAFLWGKAIKKITKANALTGSIHGALKRGKFWSFVYKKILSQYTFIYCTGKNEYNQLHKLIKSSAPIYWQPSGIESYFFDESEYGKSIDVVHIGSFLPVKNHKFILEIAAKLPGVTFSLIGDGPIKAEIEEICKCRKIKNVDFHGNRKKEEIPSILQRSKIFLLCSFSEGTPTALLEAMASGNILITSSSNDFSDFLKHNENAFIFDEFDIEQWVETIRSSLKNFTSYERVLINNKKISKKFSWEIAARKITQLMSKYNEREKI